MSDHSDALKVIVCHGDVYLRQEHEAFYDLIWSA